MTEVPERAGRPVPAAVLIGLMVVLVIVALVVGTDERGNPPAAPSPLLSATPSTG